MLLPRSLRGGVIAWQPDGARAVENVLWCYESGEAADDDAALAAALV